VTLPLPKDWPPSGFTLVYQGGHHDVWCNKVEHLTTRGGGKTRMSESWGLREPTSCDCASYRVKA
jgi:hypothetical protein